MMQTRTAAVLNLLQTVAIVAGMAYGAIELAQFRSEQQRQANTDLARSFLSPELMRAFAIVQGMPDSMTLETLQADYAEELPDLMFLLQTFETVGISVFRRDVELEAVDEFLGTAIIMSWSKLGRAYEGYRTANDAPSVAEWFQWLAERLQEYRKGSAPAPAYELHRNWKPVN
ncbi:MAG: DUF4760 domain-containing protein [Longimicrobiales bacterium]